MGNLLFGGIARAAFLRNLVALLTPCCVSVMGQKFSATGFRRRTANFATARVISLGVAAIIVLGGLGTAFIVALVSGQHALSFSIAATAMLVGVAAILSGWNLGLPMIGRTPTGHSSGVVNGLGVFSGSASPRCAPVLVDENHTTLASGLIIDIRLNAYGRLSKYALGRNRARLTDTN
jgi:cytochrome c-type biogenesis protein